MKHDPMIVGVFETSQCRLVCVVTSLADILPSVRRLSGYLAFRNRNTYCLVDICLPDHTHLLFAQSVYCHGRPLEPRPELSCRQLDPTRQGLTASSKPHVLAEMVRSLGERPSAEKMPTPTLYDPLSSPTCSNPEPSAYSMSPPRAKLRRRPRHPRWI